MNDEAVVHLPPIEAPDETRAHSLVRDEDVLSHELREALEAVGSAVGVIAALALVASQLPRAGRVIARMGKEVSDG